MGIEVNRNGLLSQKNFFHADIARYRPTETIVILSDKVTIGKWTGFSKTAKEASIMSNNFKRIENKDKHLVASFDPDTRTILIKRGNCLTAIRILPDGQLEVDGEIVA